MRAVIQRVEKANVKTDSQIVGEIKKGLLILLAIHKDDDEKELYKLADKIINLRIFEDQSGKMNLSLISTAGEVLVVSQFTLYGDTRKGKRPSFTESAPPEKAIPIYDKFVEYIRSKGIETATGKFGAKMQVSLINDGPVTIIIDQ